MMANNLSSLIPAGVRGAMRSHEHMEEKKRREKAIKLSMLLAQGKTEEAIELLASERSAVPERAERLIAKMHEPIKKVDRSAAATGVRQRRIVEILTSGQRCSLNRAYKLAGYGNHRESLDQLLSSPAVLDLFKRALEAGRPLPVKYKERIEHALEDHALGIA